IPAQQGQTLSAALEGEGVLLTVLAPNREPIADRVPSWQNTLNFTGDYTVRLSPVKGLPESDFRLNLNLQAAPAPSPSPSTPPPSPIDTPPPAEPQIEAAPLDLPLGRPIEFSDQASNTVTKRYLVDVQPRQILSVEVLSGSVTLNIRYPNGEIVEGGSGVGNWSGRIFDQGRYQIDVNATEPAPFSLRVLVDNKAR
ncbi:MAG TPA: serine/threonine protein kinase, partial [Coleofasciculaceae cyanobacterium]